LFITLGRTKTALEEPPERRLQVGALPHSGGELQSQGAHEGTAARRGNFVPVGLIAQSTDPAWVNGSSQKVCQHGEVDYETRKPTVSQTQTNYGLAGDDLGASFQRNGKLWLLFGDTNPTATFNGKPNGQSDPPRTPAANDAIPFTSRADAQRCQGLSGA
jgi:hypothetical protein